MILKHYKQFIVNIHERLIAMNKQIYTLERDNEGLTKEEIADLYDRILTAEISIEGVLLLLDKKLKE